MTSGRALELASALTLITTLACGPTDTTSEAARPTPPADENVVAVYQDGEVTRDDIDRAVLARPAGERRIPAEDPEGWFRERIHEIVLDRLLDRAAAASSATSDPSFLQQWTEVERSAVVSAYVQRHLPPIPQPTETELRKAFDEHEEPHRREESLHLFHLFRRRTDDDDVAALRAEVDTLRARLVRGETFETVARAHSDSESRHRGGELGWIRRGIFPAAVDTVIFELEEGVPSEPIVTREGIHLFLVRDRIGAKAFSFEELRPMIVQQRAEGLRNQAILALDEGLEPIPDLYRATAEELGFLFEEGDATTIVFRAGDIAVDLGRLRRMMAEARGANSEATAGELGESVLESLGRRERIYQAAVAEGLPREPEIAMDLAARRSAAVRDFYRSRTLIERLDADPESLQRFYDDSTLRFATPLRLALRQLTIPVNAEDPAAANAAMARLEEAREGLARGEQSLESLAEALGGTVAELGLRSLPELQAQDPRSARHLPDLPAGGFSPPFRTTHGLALIEVTDRQEPETQPFDAVRERVRQAYLERHGQALYGDWTRSMLDEAELTIFDDRVARLLDGEVVEQPKRGEGS